MSVTDEGDYKFVMMLAKGATRLLVSRGVALADDLERITQDFDARHAELGRLLEETRQQQEGASRLLGEVEGRQRRLDLAVGTSIQKGNDLDSKLAAAEDKIDKRVAEVDRKVANTEKRVYAQMLPIFGVFAAVVAMVVAVAQAVQGAGKDTGSAGDVLLRTMLALVVATALMGFLVWWSWFWSQKQLK